MNIFISGISSGIGKSLAIAFAKAGHDIYGLSRRELDYEHPSIRHMSLDIAEDFEVFWQGMDFDLAILNAGILGEVNTISNASLDELKATMEINLWGQKRVCDRLLKSNFTKNIYAISSGAAVKGSKGWSGYSLSKAAFKMMIEIYAQENPKTHFLNIAPGLVNTRMQDYLCDKVDHDAYPNMRRLKDARENGSMLTTDELAEKFIRNLKHFEGLDSGSFIDLRSL